MQFSVVIPAFNAAKFIAETLESILRQTEPPFEVIVVDDGSGDDTLDVLNRFAGRIRVISQANSGVSITRNRGVREATSEWVAFCDADDLWHRDKLRVVASALTEAPDAQLLFHDFWIFAGERLIEARGTHSPHSLFPLFSEFDISIPRILPDYREVCTPDAEASVSRPGIWQGDAFQWLMLGSFLQPSTLVVRKSTFEQHGGFNPAFRYAEDMEFCLRFAKRVPFTWLDAPLAGYRRSPGTLLTGNLLPTIESATRAVLMHCVEDAHVYGSHRTWVNRAACRRLTRLAYYCLSELQRDEALKYARSALRFRPFDMKAGVVALASLLPTAVLRGVRHTKARRRRSQAFQTLTP